MHVDWVVMRGGIWYFGVQVVQVVQVVFITFNTIYKSAYRYRLLTFVREIYIIYNYTCTTCTTPLVYPTTAFG